METTRSLRATGNPRSRNQQETARNYCSSPTQRVGIRWIHPPEDVNLDNTTAWKPGPIRPLTAARPAAYEKLVDPGRGLRGPQRNRLWDAHLGIWGVADRVRQCTVLWTVSERDPTVPDRQSGPGLDPGARLKRAPAYQVPQHMGFHIVERWQFSFAQVVKSTR